MFKRRISTKGITLVALVVTIVVLLILAGITMQLLMTDTGIYAKAQQAKIETRKGEILDQLNVAEADNSIKQLGNVTIESYLQEIYTKGIVVEDYTVKMDDTNYLVTTEDGYVFNVSIVGIDIIFEYAGQQGNLPPTIKVVNVTTNSIEIEVMAYGKTIKNCTYYIKEQNAENYSDGVKKSESKYTYTGLTNDKVYSVKVEVETDKGTEEVTKLVTVGKIPTGAIRQKGETVWTSGKATIELETIVEGYTIQYKVNSSGTWTNYTGAIGNLNYTDVIFARLTDGTSYGDDASINLQDNVAPQNATINFSEIEIGEGESITATVTQNDKESGIDITKCKWVYNEEATAIGTDEDSYTGGTFSSTPQTITLNLGTVGTYYLHVLSVDKVGNMIETVSSPVSVIKNVANAPKLGSGMTPIKWNGSSWVTTTQDDEEWYSYTKSAREWANAKTTDGSMWVWITRYAYQIASNYHAVTVGGGTINIKFLKDATNTATDGTTSWNNKSGQGNWNIHPAFNYGNQVSGIWVAKFEASQSDAGANAYEYQDYTGGTSGTIKIQPGVNSWRNITIDKMYTKSIEYNSTLNSHLMKNSEWGAVAYLAQSKYGRDGTEIGVNECSQSITGMGPGGTAEIYNGKYAYTANYIYTTTQGQKSSTTGNTTGIYDLSGGCHEYTAAYVNNGNSALQSGTSLVNGEAKNKDVYVVGSPDNRQSNYNANSSRYGDAVYETSSIGDGGTSWFNDHTTFPYSSSPFFVRGGYFDDTSRSGAFYFQEWSGNVIQYFGFRPVLVVL